ncbi:MAG: hypothetical protein QXJ02_03530 [Candidatus Bathyarchaeia archaeon]
MAAQRKKEKPSNVDIFQLLSETAEKTRKEQREQLLASLGIKELFVKGNISINHKTCRGVECKLCIKACPTNALFWKSGEVGIVKELCIFCGACVLCCIVDDCIKIERKRLTGQVEKFSKPKDFIALQYSVNLKKLREKIREVFPTAEEYLKYCRKQAEEKRKENAGKPTSK